MEYRSFSSRSSQSSGRAPFPPSPLQRYLATPRYEAKYKRRSFQYTPRARHRMAYVNGQLVKVYNSAWLTDFENHDKKVTTIGKTQQLLIISPFKRHGSSQDLSTIRRSPATLESPTSQGYHSSLSVPSSPFLTRKLGTEPNRCFSYNELYSPKSPSTPRKFGLGARRTYSTSDLSSSPSLDRSYGFPPYSPNYRRWTSNYDISFCPEHYSSTDYLHGNRKAGSCDVLLPPSPTYCDWRTFSRLEGGSLGYDFRSRSGSGSFFRRSRLELEDQHGGYCSHTQSECDFPVRYQGPSSKSECGISPNDIATRSESGISITLSDFDSSFVAGDEETASVGSVDRSIDRSLDSLGVFPFDYDIDRCDTESVMSHDRTLDIVYEDENSDHDQEGHCGSGKQDRGKSSVSANLLSRFEKTRVRTAGSDVQELDDDVFRQHTDILYLSDGTNIQMDDPESQHTRVRSNDSGDCIQRTQTLYLGDASNSQSGDLDSQADISRNGAHFRPQSDMLHLDGANINMNSNSQHIQTASGDDDFREHTKTLFIHEGSDIHLDDSNTSRRDHDDVDFSQHTQTLHLISDRSDDTDSQHVSDIPDDDFRQHTDTLYITDGANVQTDDTDSQHVSDIPDDDFRQHTDILYITDGANVQTDDTDSQQGVQHGQDDYREHRETLFVTDGSNVREDDPEKSDVDLRVTKSQVAVADDGRHHSRTVIMEGGSQQHGPDLPQHVAGDVGHHTDIDVSDARNVHTGDHQQNVACESETPNNLGQHAETVYVTYGSSVHQEDIGDTKSETVAETEDDTFRQHTETIYMIDGGNVNHEGAGNTKSETVAETEDDTLSQHTETIYMIDGGNVNHEGAGNTKSETVAETEDDTLRQHTETIYMIDGGNVNHEGAGNTKSETVAETEDDTFRQHTETIYMIDGGNVNHEGAGNTKSETVAETEDDALSQHTETVYITDEGNQVNAETCDGMDDENDDDIKRHTETIYFSDTGNQIVDDESLATVRKDEDSVDIVRHHTETLYLTDEDSIEDDEDESGESSESDDEGLTQHRQIVYVTDEGDRCVDDEVESHVTSAEQDEVSVDVDDVRSDTQTVYIHQSAIGCDEVLVDEDDVRHDTHTVDMHHSTMGCDDVLVDKDDLRHDTQTPYKHPTASALIQDVPHSAEADTERFTDTFQTRVDDNEQLHPDITELEISAIERSEEFEIIEMPATLLSSSFIDSGERHGSMLEDSVDYTDSLSDSTGVYSRNISVEYDRADQKAMDEFIDEREITTSSQIHLALEETDDEETHHRSDNVVSGQSSDEDYDDNISSHRLLVQSHSSLSLESEENVSTLCSMDVKQTVSTVNEFDIRENLASGLLPETVPADSESSSRYTVINQVTMETVDRRAGVTELAQSQVMVKADSDIQSHNVTEFTTQSTSERDENKAPDLFNTVFNETQDGATKPELSLETDEQSRSGNSSENWRLTGKIAEDWPKVKDPPLSEGDKSVKHTGQSSATADQYRLSSPSAAGADVKLGNEWGDGAESANSLWKIDNVVEQHVTVEIREDGKDELLGEGVGYSPVITAKTNAKVELAESEQTAYVGGAVIGPCGEETVVIENPNTSTDADSPRNGKTQELLETENVEFSSGQSVEGSGFSVSGLSGSRQEGKGVYGEELNSDCRGIGSGVEVVKNTGEWTYGVVGVVNTRRSDASSVSTGGESDFTENFNANSTQTSECCERLLNVTDSSVTLGNSDPRNLETREQIAVFNSENLAINTVSQTAAIETENGTHSGLKETDNITEYATNVRDSDEKVNERTSLYTATEELSKYATQREESPISSDELKQVNTANCETVNTCVTTPGEALNATGGVVKEPAILHSDNTNTLHIDESDNEVLSCSVQAGYLGYLSNMADSPKVSSAEGEQTREIMDDEDGLCFTDRSESILPVEERSVIRTKVQYKVKKTTKTVTKTNVDVKKVQKHSTGDSVEHEHLTKVEQTTVVRQKVCSSTESLDTDTYDGQNVKVEYKAIIDATKDKDGRQLPSAHYETSFETVLPSVVAQNVLHGESEDVLAIRGPETENVLSDECTVTAEHFTIEPSPGLIQAVGDSEDRTSHKPSDMAPRTGTWAGKTREMTESHFVVESDNVTRDVSPQTAEIDNSHETTSGSQRVTSHVTRVTNSVSADIFSRSSNASVSESDIADNTASDEGLSSVYTERTEIFIQPHALSPITVRKKRWSTERNFSDNKLICTLFEDTDSPSPQKDQALYILEDNIHVTTNSTDRREEFIAMSSKHSCNNGPCLERKPMWTYDLASLSCDRNVEVGKSVDENGSDSDSTLVDSERGETDRVVSPDSTRNDVQIASVSDGNIEAEGSVSPDNSRSVTSEVLQSDLFTNVTTTQTKQVTITNISQTREGYSYSSEDGRDITDSRTASATEASVQSLHSTNDSTLSLTGKSGVRSGAELSDTPDTVTVSALPEDQYTPWEETELGSEDNDSGSLFLGGGSSERTVDNVELTSGNTENKLVFVTGTTKSESDDSTNFSQTSKVITVKTNIDEGREEGSWRDDLWTDDNGNVLQGKQADIVSLRLESEACDLSSSSVVEERPETEDRSSTWGGQEGGQFVDETEGGVESEGNRHAEMTGGQRHLSRSVETNKDNLQSESSLVVTDTSHTVLTHQQTQAFQISSQTEGLHTRGDNEGDIFVHKETLSGLSDSDDNLRHTDRTEDNKPDLVSEGGQVHSSHTGLSTESSQQRLFTSSEGGVTQFHGSGTAYSVLETGASIDGKQTILSTPHSSVDSASTSDGLAHSGHSKVGKLNAETEQNAVCSPSVPSDDGMLINSPSLEDQQAKDLTHANVTRAWSRNEFPAENVNSVSEVETVDGSSVGHNVEREVTATGELNINAIHSIEDDSLDCDRETRIQEFSEAFRQYSIEELPLRLSQCKDESSVELRGRLTSDNDGESEEIEHSELDYDDWAENEAVQEQIHLNRTADDGLNIIEENSDSRLVKMEDISSDEVNRSMGSDQLDRLDWLESQVHVDEDPWHGGSTTRYVRVTGQVEYDSDLEENNNFVKELESSMADDSDNSDLDVSDSQYSTTMTCELRDGQNYGRPPSTSSDDRSTSVSEHMTGELKISESDMTSRYLSTSSEGYFSSSEHVTGELRLNIPQEKYRHYSSSSEGYQSVMSDQMTGELKPSPTDDVLNSSSLSTEQKTLEMIDEDLKDQIKDFENWSEHLFEGGHTENTRSFSSAEQQTRVLMNTGQTQSFGQFSTSASGQTRFANENVTQSYLSSSEQMTRQLPQGDLGVTDGHFTRTSDQTHVEMKLNELSLRQGHSTSDDMTRQVSGRSETVDHLTTGTDRALNMTLNEQTITQRNSSSDCVSNEMKEFGQSVTLRHGTSTMGQVSDQIQHGGQQIMTQTSSSADDMRRESRHESETTETHISSSSSSTLVRHTVRETCEKETYENVPDSISEKVKDELLQKAHGYFSSSVSVTLSKKWKMFEKLWHSFDESSWKGALTAHLYTFVFQKCNLGQVGSVNQFEKLYPLLLMEDVERCQNHVCTALYSDEYQKQRKMQKYFLRGFTKDIHRLWHSQRKQSLAPLCEIPEDRVVSFNDNAGVALNTCHATSIHPSVVSYSSVSPTQFHRFTQDGDKGDSGSVPSGGDNSPDSRSDNSCLQYICQGDVTDPTTMLSKRLRDLNIDENETEILDDVLLRCLRHYRSKFIKFNPYIQNDFRKSVGRNPSFPYRNATIYEEEEDEKYMD